MMDGPDKKNGIGRQENFGFTQLFINKEYSFMKIENWPRKLSKNNAQIIIQ